MQSNFELEDDIKYFKKILNRHSGGKNKQETNKILTKNNTKSNFKTKLDFVICQFKNMFYKL